MRHLIPAALIAALFLSGPTGLGGPVDLQAAPRERGHSIDVIRDSEAGTVLGFSSARGCGEADGPCTALVRVPDRGAVTFDVTGLTLSGPDGEVPAPTTLDLRGLVTLGEPAIMRDIRVVRVTFHPDAAGLPEGHRVSSLTVTVRATGRAGINERTARNRMPSPAFESVYESMVANYSRDTRGDGADGIAALASSASGRETRLAGARYLAIAEETMASLADTLLSWKDRKGLLPKLVTVAETGSTREEIKHYIQEAYDNWDIPPEFILLVGDTDYVPTGTGAVWTDNYYARLEGDDYLADVFVGRLPADDDDEIRTMLAKTMAYERPWLVGGTDWPMSATLLVREDEDHSDPVYYGNTWFIHDLMATAGYAPIDTLFSRNGVMESDIYASLSQGRGFVNYRGVSSAFWVSPFQVLPWVIAPTWELPIVMSATCLSGTYQGDEAIGEFFLRAGDDLDPRGAVAFFGTSTAGSSLELSYKRGHIDEGFFEGAFGPSRTLGEACIAGKTNLFAHFQDIEEYEGWNLLGDPDLSIWTADVADLDVTYEDVVPTSIETMHVSVLAGGAAVPDALVTLEYLPDVFSWANTDVSGNALVPLSPSRPCTLRLKVTAKNARPMEGRVTVLAAGPAVFLASSAISDDAGGNGDGLVSPGETVELTMELENLGNVETGEAQAVLRCRDPFVTVADSLAGYGSIEPRTTAWGNGPYPVEIDGGWPGAYDIPLELVVTYGDSVNLINPPPLATVSGDLEVAGILNDDGAPGGNGNGSLEPGEVVGLTLSLLNASGASLADISATLEGRNPRVRVTGGAATFGDVEDSGSLDNSDCPFTVAVAPDAAPGSAQLFARVTADAPGYAYAETLALDIDVAEVAPLFPTGPDAYGYYAYDSTDTIYARAPRFEWTEIGGPEGPGTRIDAVSDADDAVNSHPSPFVVRYYGLNRPNVSVCSNGFTSLYTTSERTGDNSGIPSSDGPPSMLAPFWDDLDPSSGGDIYAWHDTTSHRYIIEYDAVRHAGSEDTETFQVVISDPGHTDTPTGDSEILFLYKSVSDPASCTVGIEHPYQTSGLEYLYNGDYGAYAAPLRDSMAVLFTTSAPESLVFPWLVLSDWTLDDSASGNGDGVPAPGETLSLVLEVMNDGARDATGLAPALSCESGSAEILGGSFAVSSLALGASARNDADPFIVAMADAPEDSLVRLVMTMGPSANTRQGAIRLDLRIRPEVRNIEPRLALGPCRPNPFSSVARIPVGIPDGGRLTVRIYDVAGRLVRTVEDRTLPAGEYELSWDGRDGGGSRVANGVYFVRLTAPGGSLTRKTVLLK
jgi:hypothetical protein